MTWSPRSRHRARRVIETVDRRGRGRRGCRGCRRCRGRGHWRRGAGSGERTTRASSPRPSTTGRTTGDSFDRQRRRFSTHNLDLSCPVAIVALFGSWTEHCSPSGAFRRARMRKRRRPARRRPPLHRDLTFARASARHARGALRSPRRRGSRRLTQSREDVIEKDREDLHGWATPRSCCARWAGSATSPSASRSSRILTGAVILYDYGLAWAGTAAVPHRLAAR